MTVSCYYPDMDAKQYTIEDLCDISGYTRRTIRYYIQEGLLDPPAGRGRGGFYFDSHLNRLREIKALQDRGLKLAAVREVLGMGGSPESEPLRELWARYPVTRGMEIHVSRALEEEERKKIEEIIRVARSIVESGGSGNE